MPQIQPGTPKDDLDTPALCLDLDVFNENVAAMVETCRARGIQWRPHAKCHKSPEIARRLVEAGAIGVTCAKLGEAEVMADGGVTDLLIANMIVGPRKVERLVELRRRADPIVCIDDLQQAEPISAAMAAAGMAVRALVELDIGLARVGVPVGEPALALAGKVAEFPGIELAGLLAYEGHLLTVEDPHEKEAGIRAALDTVAATKQLLTQHGLPCPIVSCGGTGSYEYTVRHPVVTELQAGGAIFMDAYYRHKCQVRGLRYAVTLLTTVVSRPTAERAIIDAGRKSLNIEVHAPLVAGREGVHVERLSAEHGWVRVDSTAGELAIGDRLELIPGYVDLTTMLHDEYYVFRGDRLVDVWPITARGKLR